MQEREKKEFYLTVKGQKTVVSEEVYRAYVRPIRAEQQRERREKRCVIEKVINGKVKLVRCYGKCSACDKVKRDNSSFKFSFELMLDNGFDIPDTTVNIEENFIKTETIESLRKAITKLKPKQQKIVKMVYFDNLSQVETAKRLGISKVTVNKYLSRIFIYIKSFLIN